MKLGAKIWVQNVQTFGLGSSLLKVRLFVQMNIREWTWTFYSNVSGRFGSLFLFKTEMYWPLWVHMCSLNVLPDKISV